MGFNKSNEFVINNCKRADRKMNSYENKICSYQRLRGVKAMPEKLIIHQPKAHTFAAPEYKPNADRPSLGHDNDKSD